MEIKTITQYGMKRTEWRIPESEHRMAKLDLTKGVLTLSYFDIANYAKDDEEAILRFEDIGIFGLGLSAHPATERKLNQEADELLAEFISLLDENLPESNSRQEEILEQLKLLEKRSPTDGKTIGLFTEGLVYSVVKLDVFQSLKGYGSYAYATLVPKANEEYQDEIISE